LRELSFFFKKRLKFYCCLLISKFIFCYFIQSYNEWQRFATLRWLEIRNRSIFGLTKTWCETIIPRKFSYIKMVVSRRILFFSLKKNSCISIINSELNNLRLKFFNVCLKNPYLLLHLNQNTNSFFILKLEC
jgi:hypothetical protein